MSAAVHLWLGGCIAATFVAMLPGALPPKERLALLLVCAVWPVSLPALLFLRWRDER